MIGDLDANEGVALVDETQRKNDQDMFDTSILVAEKEVSTADPVPTADEVVTTAGVKTSKPKSNGIVMQEPSETPTPTLIYSSQQPSNAKDKGKAKIIEDKKPLKRKDQIMVDEEVSRNIKAQMQAELVEEERLTRQKEEVAKTALIESWDNTQAMMDADYELASKLQEEKRGKLIVEKKSSSKRARYKLEQEDAKRQRIEEENESVELKRCLEIIPDSDDDVTIEATPLSSKSPTIVDYKIYKEGRKIFFKIIRVDARFQKTKPVDDMGNLLFQSLKIMFEHHVEDNIWKYQQETTKVLNWKLFDSSRVYCVTT
nr:hypothetical protein [Tanacetum cinerariifolium]